MGRKVAWAMAIVVAAIVSASLAGGQVGGFLWWGTHEPIYIYGDDDFTYSNGVMSGSGTEADPYIIEGWNISPVNADYGVYVDHTTRHFVIRDCVVETARIAGVYLNSVENGSIERVQISTSDVAVYLLNSHDNRIASSVFSECNYGVVMGPQSQANVVTGNSFFDNGLPAFDPQHWNSWYEGKKGNYWSDYEGGDENKDGVGDEPYYSVGDLHPLLTAPAQLTTVQPAGPSYAGNLVAPDGSLVVTSQTPITLTATDPGSGVAEIKYSIDGGTWTTYAGPIYLKGDDGPRKISYYGVDRLGNAELKKTVSFLLDNHAPQTAMDIGDPKFTDVRGTWVTSETPITLRRTQESTYGRSVTYYRINDGAWVIYSTPFRMSGDDGPRSVSFYSRNASGVVEGVQTKLLIKDDAAPTSRGAKAQAPGSISVTTGGTAAAPQTTPAPASKPVAPVAPSSPAPAATTTRPPVTAAPTTTAPAPASTTLTTTPAPTSGSVSGPSASPTASTTSSVTPDATAQAELAGAALGQPGTSAPVSTTPQTPSQVVPSSAPTQTQSSTASPSSSK